MRRDFKNVNLPVEVADYIDALVKATRGQRTTDLALPLSLGVQSRDEYLRIAVAILILATQPEVNGKQPLKIVQDLVDKLERAAKRNSPP